MQCIRGRNRNAKHLYEGECNALEVETEMPNIYMRDNAMH